MSVVCALATSIGARAQAVDKRPNLMVILTDDQRWDAFDATVMPEMSQRLVEGENAVYLSNAFVSNPVCCPSSCGAAGDAVQPRSRARPGVGRSPGRHRRHLHER